MRTKQKIARDGTLTCLEEEDSERIWGGSYEPRLSRGRRDCLGSVNCAGAIRTRCSLRHGVRLGEACQAEVHHVSIIITAINNCAPPAAVT